MSSNSISRPCGGEIEFSAALAADSLLSLVSNFLKIPVKIMLATVKAAAALYPTLYFGA